MVLASKKYVDLIYDACDQYANWEPAKPIAEVGDYGTLNEETGGFVWEGNIFKKFPNAEFAQLPPGLVALRHKVITSANAVAIDIDTDLEFGVPQVQLSLSAGWFWSRRAGAALVINHPVASFLHPRTNLARLFSETQLRDKYVVRQVITCRSYALYLGRAGDNGVKLGFDAQAASGLVGPSLEGAWKRNWTNGVYECGISDDPTKSPFTVLLSLLPSPELSFFDWLFNPPVPIPPQPKTAITAGPGAALPYRFNAVWTKVGDWELAQGETSENTDSDSNGQHANEELDEKTVPLLRDATLSQFLTFEAERIRLEDDWELPESESGRKSSRVSDVVFHSHAENVSRSETGDELTSGRPLLGAAHDTLVRKAPKANLSGFNHEQLEALEPWLRNQLWNRPTDYDLTLDQLLEQTKSPLGRVQDPDDKNWTNAPRPGVERPELLGEGAEAFGPSHTPDSAE